MNTLIFFIVSIVRIFLSVEQMLMLARAIISWLPFDDDSPIQRFLFVTTEPLILPVRNILDRFGLFAGLPIDLSFMFTYIIISFISVLLPTVYF